MRDQLANAIMSNRAVDNWAEPLPSDFDLADAIIAALPDMVQLDWRDSYGVIRADTKFGSYQTSASGKILTLGVAPMSPQTVCANLDDAKAAAQADYTRRILSAFGITGET